MLNFIFEWTCCNSNRRWNHRLRRWRSVPCFRYVITEPPDQIWGHRLPNGTWAGMTGMLHRQVENSCICSQKFYFLLEVFKALVQLSWWSFQHVCECDIFFSLSALLIYIYILSQSRIGRMTTCSPHSHNSAAFGCWKPSGCCIDFFSVLHWRMRTSENRPLSLRFSRMRNGLACKICRK